MANFNKVILVGNITRDIEVKYLASGTPVCELGLAVNRTWNDKSSGEKKSEAVFVDVTCWGRTAEIAGEYLRKGRSVLIEGRLQQDQWEDKATGQKRSKLKVVCENLQMLGSKNDSSSDRQESPQEEVYQERPPAAAKPEPQLAWADTGDVPF